MSNQLEQSQNQNFLNLETLRMDGHGVKTPVWFVQNGKRLYVRTMSDSWKVKRMRNYPQVNIVPCKTWVTPSASGYQPRHGCLPMSPGKKKLTSYSTKSRGCKNTPSILKAICAKIRWRRWKSSCSQFRNRLFKLNIHTTNRSAWSRVDSTSSAFL